LDEYLVQHLSLESFSGLFVGTKCLENDTKDRDACKVDGLIVISIVEFEESLKWISSSHLTQLLYDSLLYQFEKGE